MAGMLDAYTEAGAADWVLRYASSTVAAQGLILGLRGQYDQPMTWGTLSPTARIQFRHGMSSRVSQSMGYAADPGATYALSVTGTQQDSLSTSLGIRVSTKTGQTGQIEYINNASVSGPKSNGLRGMIMVPF